MKSLTDHIPVFGGMAARNIGNELKAEAHGNVPRTCFTESIDHPSAQSVSRLGREKM